MYREHSRPIRPRVAGDDPGPIGPIDEKGQTCTTSP